MARSGILTAGTRALGYDIVTLIGQGQFGEVYEVIDTTVGHRSALKLICVTDPTTHKAVIEAQAQYLCSHDNVVKIITADEIVGGGISYLAIEMEFIPEGSLEDRIQKSFVSIKEAVHHIKQILFALEHAHNRQIVHRDVKPGNILLSTPRTKLSDFGTVINPASGAKVTDAFYVPHAPPEALNSNDFSPLCDIYAAGLTLLRASNNVQDWSGFLASLGDWRAVAKSGKLAARMGFQPHVPRALRSIINRACCGNVNGRFASAAAFRGALEGLRFANDWVRVSDFYWKSAKHQREQKVFLKASNTFSVIYTINGRRRNELCQTFHTEDKAISYMNKIIYESTLAKAAPKS